ncbi:hypothetical protein HPB52_017926 [Rhipicephalus sanguineus]|uniref:Peptidase S54 rhomboid domain-containing protein n=1 Tax=Rhipicephalus sanguineus TaxID=34632 RepID=A0A9D4SYW7_RHISA|nr:hypothetical protein HPB52_017926 [Rhipicephalus sanguineus]
MSEKTSAEQAESQQRHRERRDWEHSSDNVTASDEGQDVGQPSAATTAQLSSSVTAESEQRSPRHTDGEESGVSLGSFVRKSGASSSDGKRLEPEAVFSEPSVPARSQTPEPANMGYRPLVHQFPPERTHRDPRSSNPTLNFPSVTAEHDWPDAQHSPLSPRPPGTPPQRSENFSMLWDDVASPDANTGATVQPVTRASQSDEHLPLRKPVLQKAKEDLYKESTRSADLNALAAAQSRTRVSEDVDMNASQEPRDPGSPRLLVLWSETPKRIDVRRGTPEVIRDASSLSLSVSTSEVSSPQIGTALSSPRLRRVASSSTPRFPWATLAVICLQLHAHWNHLHKDYPERCASVSTIMIENRCERLLFAAFHHVDVNNLALNSLCFFATGVLLEAGLGTVHFAVLFATVAALVGAANTFALMLAYEYTRLSWLFTTCLHTFAGVIVALQVLTIYHFGRARIRYGNRKFQFPSMPFGILEMVTFLACTKHNNYIVMCSGFLVGRFLARTSPGNFITRTRRPRRYLHLCVVPYAPITYMFAAFIIAAFLYGPFPDAVTLADTGLSFPHPLWRPLILPLLYQPNICMLAYVVLSLLDVGKELEQDFGHIGFLCLAGTLLLAVNGLLGFLSGTIWCHLLALGENLPTPVPHSSLCTCTPVATLMALKVIHHVRHPRCVYSMTSVAIHIPFWTGMLLARFSDIGTLLRRTEALPENVPLIIKR